LIVTPLNRDGSIALAVWRDLPLNGFWVATGAFGADGEAGAFGAGDYLFAMFAGFLNSGFLIAGFVVMARTR
jgi:hypothetical protein